MKDFKLPNRYRLVVRHFHAGNDCDNLIRKDIENETLTYQRRRTSPYATEVGVMDTQTNTIVANGISLCAPTDQPCRQLGYDIAVGRALKDFQSTHTQELAA